jgi:hypothetical protein
MWSDSAMMTVLGSVQVNAGGSALLGMLGSNTWMIVGGSARVGAIAEETVLGWESLGD